MNIVAVLIFSVFAFSSSGMPRLKIVGRSVLNKPLVFSAMNLHEKNINECHLFVISPKGATEFYRKLNKVCFDFRPHKIDGKTYYSYVEVKEFIRYAGYIGPRVILDDKFNEVKRIAEENEMHEFHYLASDHWLGFEIELGRLINGKSYMNKRLRERKKGEIIFDWGTSDIIAQFGSEAATYMFQTTFRNETVAELFHLNAIQILKNGFLVGLGHDGIGFLDRKTKKLKWVLGGIHDSFNLGLELSPLFNHTPHLNEETGVLHVFSNRSIQRINQSYSRVIRYELDLSSLKLKSFKVLRSDQEIVNLLGSLQVSEGIMNIGFGSKEKADWDFIEADDNGVESWKIKLDEELKVYRFYREPT